MRTPPPASDLYVDCNSAAELAGYPLVIPPEEIDTSFNPEEMETECSMKTIRDECREELHKNKTDEHEVISVSDE